MSLHSPAVSLVASPSLQEICCCMGQPVAGNPTQYVMEMAFARAGLDWRYLTLEVAPEALGVAVAGARAMGFRGVHLLRPHKRPALAHCDELTDAARLSGAVTCITRDDDRLVGDNTDGRGLITALREHIDPAGKRAAVLGAGPAAAAAAAELALAGAAALTIVCRNAEEGRAIIDRLAELEGVASALVQLEGNFAPNDLDVIINASTANPAPIALDAAPAELIVADMTLNPPQTDLLRMAASHGCPTVDGLAMLAAQRALAFEMWTGVPPDAALMRENLEEFLGV